MSDGRVLSDYLKIFKSCNVGKCLFLKLCNMNKPIQLISGTLMFGSSEQGLGKARDFWSNLLDNS